MSIVLPERRLRLSHPATPFPDEDVGAWLELAYSGVLTTAATLFRYNVWAMPFPPVLLQQDVDHRCFVPESAVHDVVVCALRHDEMGNKSRIARGSLECIERARLSWHER